MAERSNITPWPLERYARFKSPVEKITDFDSAREAIERCTTFRELGELVKRLSFEQDSPAECLLLETLFLKMTELQQGF